MKVLCVGDAMIPGASFASSAAALALGAVEVADWERDAAELQRRRLVVEQRGPAADSVPAAFSAHADASIVLGLFCPFSAAGMDAFDRLRLIGVARAGTENVEMAAASERGVLVINVLGRNAEAVSDFAVGLMLAEARNIARAHEGIRNGDWPKRFSNSASVPELKGKTVGLVGLGRIGELVARKLGGFRVELIATDPHTAPGLAAELGVEVVERRELFARADFVSLHARLGPETCGLVGAPELKLMKPTAYLVNTARAGLVDDDALVGALREGRIAGAALDVFESEPLPAHSPLLQLGNVTLTSHIAGTTREALTRSPELLVEAVEDVLAGRPGDTLCNPEVLERPDVRAWLDALRER